MTRFLPRGNAPDDDPTRNAQMVRVSRLARGNTSVTHPTGCERHEIPAPGCDRLPTVASESAPASRDGCRLLCGGTGAHLAEQRELLGLDRLPITRPPVRPGAAGSPLPAQNRAMRSPA